ncbi:hypothetical protein [Empedobacter sp. UBA5637]|uniref:hypothetical protein n=1 Tax=Empedobacter sp. UBA5637 TaxID=1946442 RepID=UPI0025B80C05|nr:hypothetical protein [Empedobacter sp. UBA5637]
MTIEEIQNKYAVEEFYKDWESLLKNCIEFNQLESLQFHINTVSNLIQEEFRFKILKNVELVNDFEKVNISILNTSIIR